MGPAWTFLDAVWNSLAGICGSQDWLDLGDSRACTSLCLWQGLGLTLTLQVFITSRVPGAAARQMLRGLQLLFPRCLWRGGRGVGGVGGEGFGHKRRNQNKNTSGSSVHPTKGLEASTVMFAQAQRYRACM